jgi:hypothetical protein
MTTEKNTQSTDSTPTNDSTVQSEGRSTGLLATVLDDLRARRVRRAEARRLRQELSAYTTKSDLDDLYATFDRYDDQDTELVRSILSERLRHAA